MKESYKNLKIIKKESISVDFFYKECKDRFKLRKITKKQINKNSVIKVKDIHRPGLALAGYVELFAHKRVQIFGNSEIKFLSGLSKKEQEKSLEKFFSFDIPCIVITNNNEVPPLLLKKAEEKKVAIFRTPYSTSQITYFINDFLDDQFAPQASIHGSFVDVYGVGLLFCGASGIGKSEIALDLVERGHRLVADDLVILTRKSENVLIGSGTSLAEHFMELRGVGIINVKRIFGIRAIRYQKRVEVIVELELWDPKKSYERTGLNLRTTNLMGVEVEIINLPIFPGKNITVIAEVIALNYLCKHYGYNAAKEFKRRLNQEIKMKSKNNLFQDGGLKRATEWFEHDFE
ncbi:MAG: HPr(Ser) kinase/phosphatase [Ignavibacteria bacterium]|nr:HPr(Ser) kinase/phosphatase [Ignavibacteria bacterium]